MNTEDYESQGSQRKQEEATEGSPGDVAEQEEVTDGLETPKDVIETLEAQLKEAKDSHLRTLAEMENVRKRHTKERQEALTYGAQKLLDNLLPVIDNFERAMVLTSTLDGPAKALAGGLQMIEKELHSFLEKQSVKRITAEGAVFDPHLHEAMQEEESATHEAGHIIRVIQTGYQLGERLLRPALVVVSKAPAVAEGVDDTQESQNGDEEKAGNKQ